jgi:hypothetical protein
MKVIAIILFALFISRADASYFATFCSNSTGSVSWESGHTSNLLKLKTYTDTEESRYIPLHLVKIEYLNEILLDEKIVRECSFFSKTRIYASRVRLSGKALEETETEVICSFHIHSLRPCPYEI